MDTVFLPGNVRQRLSDLMKRYNVSQTEFARKIGCNDSLLSRFLSEKTDKLSDENIIRIIRAFNVSTDFLPGATAVPDRKNYEIDELGLSAQVARNLYTGKANAQVVNYLLESPCFLELTYILEQYFKWHGCGRIRRAEPAICHTQQFDAKIGKNKSLCTSCK